MNPRLRNKLKKNPPFKIMAVAYKVFRNKYSLRKKFRALIDFLNDYKIYRKLPKNGAFSLETADLYPRIFDKTGATPLDPIYFYQGCWCARKIFDAKPAHHYDIASQALMVGIISQLYPTTTVDIRPLPLLLENLSFIKGNILNLPFKDGEIASLSSICVLEHIGLGRYGDPLDSFGSEKAFKELIRVLAPGGSLYISVPVDKENKVYFNAHRAFTRDYIMELSDGLNMEEEKYIYGNEMLNKYDKKKGFGIGLYRFKKI